MSITLTGKEIRDLAEFAGFVITEQTRSEEDHLDAEITVMDCPEQGLSCDDIYVHYQHIAYFSEYPEEGSIGLGDEIGANSK